MVFLLKKKKNVYQINNHSRYIKDCFGQIENKELIEEHFNCVSICAIQINTDIVVPSFCIFLK